MKTKEENLKMENTEDRESFDYKLFVPMINTTMLITVLMILASVL